MPRRVISRDSILPVAYEPLPDAPPSHPIETAQARATQGYQQRMRAALQATALPNGAKVPTPELPQPAKSALRIPFRRWGHAAATMGLAASAGVAGAVQTYWLPELGSPSMLRRLCAATAASQALLALQNVSSTTWATRCAADLTCRVVRRLGGHAGLADDQGAGRIVGASVARLEPVLTGVCQLLSLWSYEAGTVAVAMYMMLSQEVDLSPWLIGAAVVSASANLVAGCVVQPRLVAQAALGEVRNREQLDTLASLCGSAAGPTAKSWQERRVQGLESVRSSNVTYRLVQLGADLTSTAATVGAYYAAGWLNHAEWNPEQSTAMISTVISTGQITRVVAMVPSLVGSLMQYRAQARQLQVRLETLATNNVEEHIKWPALTFQRNGESASASELLQALTHRTPGHWRIGGAPQSGGTSLLRALKIYEGQAATLVPKHPELRQDGSAFTTQTAAVRMQTCLDEALSVTNPTPVLLLNSWQASLPGPQGTIWDQRIRDAAQRKTVVEVYKGSAAAAPARRSKLERSVSL